jgi:2-succinyl-5-enolpyruvyl-6-hydroxy-3-cyclohexene-1-carboxylate synthase
LNYFPAIAEAFYQQIPLVVITADRPQEWINQGDGQTIQQKEVFGQHVLAFAQLNPIFSDDQRWMFERQLAETLQRANGTVKGPVHLNVPLSEPLYETVEVAEGLNNWMQLASNEVVLSQQDEVFLKELLATRKKRLLIIGQQQKDEKLQLLIDELLKDGSVAVLVEHTSNIQSEYAVHCIDRALNCMKQTDVHTYQPDVIITIGGAVISKRIKRFLRNANAPVIRFGAAFPTMDTYQHLAFTSETSALNGVQFMLRFLQENPAQFIAIEGHTDDIGNAANNQILSEKRALAVKMQLIKLGIDADRIQTRGLGNTVPNEKLNRQKNRRIEIKLR